ncbi:MAG: ABC transporter permease [Oscillospiraceae bacterium]|nr:ABC transporter permease [Oscillospiraceae bacterium]
MIFRYLVRNMMENKARFFLVLFSIAVSAALLFATEGMSRTCREMYLDQIYAASGNADIQVTVKTETGLAKYIADDALAPTAPAADYVMGVLRAQGLYAPDAQNMVYLNVLGTTLDALAQNNPVVFAARAETPFEGAQIIVGQRFAARRALSVGDAVTVRFLGRAQRFTVYGIAQATGLFLNESTEITAVVPKEALGDLLDARNQSNLFFVKLHAPDQIEAQMAALRAALPACDVSRPVNPDELAQIVSTVVLPFRVASVVVIFMTVFIIYTAFTLIMKERTQVYGSFRSVGATGRKMNALLVLESGVYGILGGVFGVLIGLGVLWAIVDVYVTQLGGGLPVSVQFGGRDALAAVLYAAALTIASALFPIVRLSKTSVKEMILGAPEGARSGRRVVSLMLMMVVVYLLCLFIPGYLPTGLMSMILTIVCMSCLLLVTMLAVTQAVRFAARLLTRVCGGGVFWLAIRNVGGSKSLLNIVRLLTISLAGVLVIRGVSEAISYTVESVYEEYHLYDVSLQLRRADEEALAALRAVPGVASFVGDYELNDVEVSDRGFFLNTLYGIESEDFFDYMGAGRSEKAIAAVRDLGAGRHIVVTELLASKLGLAPGDAVQLRLGGRDVAYTVTALIDSSFKLGNIAFISAGHMTADAGLSFYTHLYVKANGAPDEVKNAIRQTFLDEILFMQTLEELVAANQDFITGMFRIIGAYAIFALLVGIIGIVNNILVSVFDRGRDIATYRALGMEKKKVNRLFLTEALLTGVFGVLFGFAAARGTLYITPGILGFIFGRVKMRGDMTEYLIFGAAALVVMGVLSLLAIWKNKKMSLIERIKYE